MTATSAIEPAIEACYDAAFDFKLWPEALQKLADSLGASSCVIRTCDHSHPFRSDQRHRTVPTPDSSEHGEFAALWLSRIEGAPDPHTDWRKRSAKRATGFFVEDQISTPEERRILPYYQEIARPGHREWYAVVCFIVNNRSWALPLYRDDRNGPFDLRDADHYMRVAPDMKRIISMAEKIWQRSAVASLAALDRLSCAAVLLDAMGHVSRLNGAADALLGSGLTVRHGRLRAMDRASDVRLQALVHAGASLLPGRIEQAEPVVIARQGIPWLLAEVTPMTSFVRDLFNGGDSLLCLTELNGQQKPSEDLLRLTFNLTAAEARLAKNLATGDGIAAASAELEISRATARTQLRMIFAKTGTRRQAELSALLSRLGTTRRNQA
jgi:DNA-binding CsgD family transcriptional regulator